MGTGIDQLNLHSVQLGYLKILQVGNADPNSEPVSPSQLGGRHSNSVVTTPMIAFDFSGTTHQSASHNVAFNQVINQSINQAQDAKQLKHNFKTEENTYPKAYTNRRTLGQDFTKSVERTGSSRFLKSTVPISKLISIDRETQEEFSATNITQNHGGKRRQSTEKSHAGHPDATTDFQFLPAASYSRLLKCATTGFTKTTAYNLLRFQIRVATGFHHRPACN
ncbi:DNAJ heat shock N-terminal domain-containing protein [Dorcoceras hygrometricum]|uniref:DNAJ heat shock N-terminal domain-containing protein n=1 Tax=Dorcoceras hygrometricum TaxID=472368 RepID=A0A2Z7DF58_9LAMI|nr:DNAJ heat shock N-terminal domain-containing protein [Dorcoceras hygrometricum]